MVGDVIPSDTFSTVTNTTRSLLPEAPDDLFCADTINGIVKRIIKIIKKSAYTTLLFLKRKQKNITVAIFLNFYIIFI